MNHIYLQQITATVYLYIAIGTLALFALGITFFLLTKKNQPKKEQISIEFLEDIYLALGKKVNIKHVELVQKRLQVDVESIKQIDQEKLKSLNMPAFVTGKKITLLLKDNSNEVYKYLNEKRKEEV